MTSPTDTLVERVAAAMFGAHQRICAWDEADQDYREVVLDEARAAIRVVAEHCAELCALPAFGVDATAFGDPVKWSRPPTSYEIAARIRNLIPQDPA